MRFRTYLLSFFLSAYSSHSFCISISRQPFLVSCFYRLSPKYISFTSKWKQVPSASFEITVVQNPLQLNEFLLSRTHTLVRRQKLKKMFWKCAKRSIESKRMCAKRIGKEFVYIFGQHFSNVLKQYKYLQTHTHTHVRIYSSHIQHAYVNSEANLNWLLEKSLISTALVRNCKEIRDFGFITPYFLCI